MGGTELFIRHRDSWFKFRDVEADGNCMYYCLAKCPSSQSVSTEQIRYAISQMMKKPSEKLMNFFIEYHKTDENPKPSLDEWMEAVMTDAEWGSNFESTLYGIIYGVDVRIVTNSPAGLEESDTRTLLDMYQLDSKRMIPKDAPKFYLYLHKHNFPQVPTKKPNHFAILDPVDHYPPKGSFVYDRSEERIEKSNLFQVRSSIVDDGEGDESQQKRQFRKKSSSNDTLIEDGRIERRSSSIVNQGPTIDKQNTSNDDVKMGARARRASLEEQKHGGTNSKSAFVGPTENAKLITNQPSRTDRRQDLQADKTTDGYQHQGHSVISSVQYNNTTNSSKSRLRDGKHDANNRNSQVPMAMESISEIHRAVKGPTLSSDGSSGTGNRGNDPSMPALKHHGTITPKDEGKPFLSKPASRCRSEGTVISKGSLTSSSRQLSAATTGGNEEKKSTPTELKSSRTLDSEDHMRRVQITSKMRRRDDMVVDPRTMGPGHGMEEQQAQSVTELKAERLRRRDEMLVDPLGLTWSHEKMEPKAQSATELKVERQRRREEMLVDPRGLTSSQDKLEPQPQSVTEMKAERQRRREEMLVDPRGLSSSQDKLEPQPQNVTELKAERQRRREEMLVDPRGLTWSQVDLDPQPQNVVELKAARIRRRDEMLVDPRVLTSSCEMNASELKAGRLQRRGEMSTDGEKVASRHVVEERQHENAKGLSVSGAKAPESSKMSRRLSSQNVGVLNFGTELSHDNAVVSAENLDQRKVPRRTSFPISAIRITDAKQHLELRRDATTGKVGRWESTTSGPSNPIRSPIKSDSKTSESRYLPQMVANRDDHPERRGSVTSGSQGSSRKSTPSIPNPSRQGKSNDKSGYAKISSNVQSTGRVGSIENAEDRIPRSIRSMDSSGPPASIGRNESLDDRAARPQRPSGNSGPPSSEGQNESSDDRGVRFNRTNASQGLALSKGTRELMEDRAARSQTFSYSHSHTISGGRKESSGDKAPSSYRSADSQSHILSNVLDESSNERAQRTVRSSQVPSGKIREVEKARQFRRPSQSAQKQVTTAEWAALIEDTPSSTNLSLRPASKTSAAERAQKVHNSAR